MNRRPRSRSGDGFTLIEVLAAFVIIAIVLPPVAQGISVCAKAHVQARTLVEVATLAHGKLNELLAYQASTQQSWQGLTVAGDFSPEHPEYRWTAASFTFADYIDEVVLIVTWTDAMGERSWTLSTLVYDQVSYSQESSG